MWKVSVILELPAHHTAHLGLGFALLDVVALIILRFAFAQTQPHFDAVLLPIEAQGDDGMTFGHDLHFQLADFVLVQEQLAAGFGIMIEPVAEGVLVNVGVIEMELTLIDLGKGIPNLTAPGAQRFHFGPFEDDARFVGLQNEVIPAGFGVGDDVCHKKQNRKIV